MDSYEDKDGKPAKKTKFVVRPMTFMFQSATKSPNGIDSKGVDQRSSAPKPQTADVVEDPEEDVPW